MRTMPEVPPRQELPGIVLPRRHLHLSPGGELMSADWRVQAVTTGQPEVRLLSCVLCGVIVWDIDAHYVYTHQDES